ncbi:hypothetical protein ACTG15_17940 [Aeromonas sp. 164P]
MLNADKAAPSDSQSISGISTKSATRDEAIRNAYRSGGLLYKKSQNRLVNILVFITRWLAELSVKRTSDKVSLIVKMKDQTPVLLSGSGVS